jgi:hypothetical protein
MKTANTTADPQNTQKSKKMGRPPKEFKGKMVWIPGDLVEFVETYLEVAKQKQPQTAETK